MLATPGPLPSGPDWSFEVKFDGIRLICTVVDGRPRLSSRNGKDLTSAFPELHPLATTLPRDTVIDGELVSAAPGVPTLQGVAPRIHRTNAAPSVQRAHPVRYVVFDLLRLAGADLLRQPLRERRAALHEALENTPNWTLSESFTDGAALSSATAEQGFEGVVAKRSTSPYQPGVRSRDWIKVVHRHTEDLVILGWRGESGGRTRIGSLIVAEVSDGALRYAGSVGSGMTQTLSDALSGVLPSIARDSPFLSAPRDSHQWSWVEPVLVVSVKYLGHTGEGQLRHPVIVALRPDLTAAELIAGSL